MRKSSPSLPISHPLQAGSRVLLETKTGESIAASVSSVGPDEICIQIARPAFAELFKKKKQVRIQYWEERTVYCWEAEVTRVVKTDSPLVEVAIQGLGLTVQGRKHLRVSLNLPFSFVVTEAFEAWLNGLRVEQCKTQNISMGGLKFETDLPLKVGDKLALRLQVSPKQQVNACAWVVRSVPAREDEETPRAVALEFLQIEEEEQLKLLQLMARATPS